MAKERRDSKNRILNKGEYQKSDGRYMYRYTDERGNSRFVYSWTLTQTDRSPKGKVSDKCLREMEKDIAKDLQDGIDTFYANRLTLNYMWDKYYKSKSELKITTKANYSYLYNTHIRNAIGNKNISDIKYSDIKNFYNLLIKKGLKISSISNIQIILHPVFETAVRDGYIRINPTESAFSDFKRKHISEETKQHALTEEQQEAFISYIKTHNVYHKYMLIFTLLLGTGCRIGEALGLCWQDCDFENDIINIRHNLCYVSNPSTGKYERHICTPKTKAGIRQIPMLRDVRRALLKERMKQMQKGFNDLVIDGCSGFIFFNKSGSKTVPDNISIVLKKIICRYNEAEIKKAQNEYREALLLPDFSLHNLRHTFCTRMCENGVNIKVVQEIMGHSSISTTMDIYNEATLKRKKEAFMELEGKIKIS